jgi:hypothetical protein
MNPERLAAWDEIARLERWWRLPYPAPDRRPLCIVCGQRIDAPDVRRVARLKTTVHRPGSGPGCLAAVLAALASLPRRPKPSQVAATLARLRGAP